MAYRGEYFRFKEFGGGVNSAAKTNLAANEASAAVGLIIGPAGGYIRAAWGFAQGNNSEFGSADNWPTQGVGQFVTTAGNEYVLTVRKGKVYSSSFSRLRNGLSFSDITGAFAGIATRSTEAEARVYNRTSFVTFNNLAVGFGGSMASPDTPFKWSGSGNIAALGGSPPAACKAFSVNNRVFAYGNFTTNPQRISWSVLGDVEDWTGTGSGSAEVGGLEDGEPLLGHAVLSNDITLLFKKNSIYQMVTTEAPFSIHLLFNGIGAIAPDGIIVKDGKAFFISTDRRLVATDGESLEPAPDKIKDVFSYLDSISVYDNAGYRGLFAAEQDGKDFNWLAFIFAEASSYPNGTSYMVAWDTNNKCWVNCGEVPNSTVPAPGFVPYNCGQSFSDGTFWGGGTHFGKVYQPDYSGITSEDSSIIGGSWVTGWMTLGAPNKIVQANRVGCVFDTVASASALRVYYGYDYLFDSSKFVNFTVTPSSTELRANRSTFLTGRGNAIKLRLSLQPSMGKLYEVYLGGKSYGQKATSYLP